MGRSRRLRATEDTTIIAFSTLGVALLLATVITIPMLFFGGCELAHVAFVWALTAPTTLALTVFIVARCLRQARNADGARTACVLGGLIGGSINVPLTIIVAGTILGGTPESSVAGTVAGVFAGPCIGSPVGLIFGTVVLPFLEHVCRQRRSLETKDRIVRIAGAWLASVAALSASVLLVLMAHHEGTEDGAAAVTLAWLAALAIGLAASATASQKIAWRRTFVDRVRSGLEEGWEIVPLAASQGIPVGLQPVASNAERPTAILAKRVRGGGAGGVYRTGTILTPHAWL